MKKKFTLSLNLLLITIGLGINSMNAIPISFINDTLILETEKHIGYGLLGGSYSNLNIQEIADTNEILSFIPHGIINPKYGETSIDYKQNWYKRLKKKNHEYLSIFLKDHYPEKIDTANLLLETNNYVKVLVGTKNNIQVYIVDENNNNDFRDDSIRSLRKEKTETSELDPVKIQFQIYDGKEIVKDSSWVYIRLVRDNEVYLSVAHHLKSTFIVDDNEYEIQCVNGPPYLRFCFDSPNISVTAQNGVKKDSILLSETFEIGEYLKFGEYYYKFENVTNNGSKITLVKEKDVSGIIGNQVGFIAPNFKSVTVEGDSISLEDYKGEHFLIVNITACWSQPMSYEHYKELSEKYNTKVAIVAIDESLGALQANIEQLELNGKFLISKNNPSLKQTYREDVCSRVCYLISPNGKLIDKFEISDWKKTLTKHFE